MGKFWAEGRKGERNTIVDLNDVEAGGNGTFGGCNEGVLYVLDIGGGHCFWRGKTVAEGLVAGAEDVLGPSVYLVQNVNAKPF